MKYTKKQLEILEKLKQGYELHRDMTAQGGWTIHNPKDKFAWDEKVNVSTAIRFWRENLLSELSSIFPTEKWGLRKRKQEAELK